MCSSDLPDIAESKSVRVVTGIAKETKKGDKIINRLLKTYPDPYYSIEYAPDKIISGTIVYNLRYPLRSSFKNEGGFFIIQSEMLDIIGTGLTEKEAEESFAEEFDYIYQKLNQLEEDQLTEHNKLIKININHIVLKVEE